MSQYVTLHQGSLELCLLFMLSLVTEMKYVNTVANVSEPHSETDSSRQGLTKPHIRRSVYLTYLHNFGN